MADTGTEKLSARSVLKQFTGNELFPVVAGGKTLAGTPQTLAEFVAPIAAQQAPVSEAAQASADAAAESSQAAAEAANSAEAHAAVTVTNAGKATDAAAAAQIAADSLAQTGGATPYQTLALLNAVTPTDPKQLGYVTNDPTSANNGLYSWSGSAWVLSTYDPLTRARAYTDAETASRTALVDSAPSDVIVDKNGFAILGFLKDRIKAYTSLDSAQLIASNGTVMVLDPYGFGYDLLATLRAVDRLIMCTGAGLIARDNRILILDRFGFGYDLIGSLNRIDALGAPVPQRATVDVSQPLITSKIAFWAGKQLSLDVSSLLQDRAGQSTNEYVLASFVSHYYECCIDATRTLTLPPTQDIPGLAYLFLRDKLDQRTRSRSTLTIVPTPEATSGDTVKLLCLGDSIVEMGGAPLAKKLMSEHGYTVNMVGTYLSNTVAYKGATLAAELCEGRGGWMAKDYTHRDPTHLPITSVADYNALSNADKKAYNPFIRTATDDDNPADVNNGCIFDFADYLSKFGLATPDVVYIGLGTNDINKQSFGSFSAAYPLDIATLVRQVKAGAPSAKIVLGFPSASMTPQRNALWPTYYFAGIRDLIAAASSFGVAIAPTWLAFSGESEYVFTVTSTDAVTGVESGYYTETDLLHPYDGARFILYDVISATLVAAFKNLI